MLQVRPYGRGSRRNHYQGTLHSLGLLVLVAFCLVLGMVK
jgi:hypothetical protein